jgi:hypothetical protein
MTRQIVDIAGPLGIAVHDHIIVGKDRHASLRGLKLMQPDPNGSPARAIRLAVYRSSESSPAQTD